MEQKSLLAEVLKFTITQVNYGSRSSQPSPSPPMNISWATENEASNIAQCMIICRNRQAPMSWEAVNWFNLSEDNLCAYFTWPYLFLQILCLPKLITQPHCNRRWECRESRFIALSFTMADIAEGKDPLFSGWISLGSVTLIVFLSPCEDWNSILYDQARYLTPFD